jgi:predicted Rossmann fold flavoprotein
MLGREEHLDAIVLGAGAAGLLCAIEAGRRGRRVAVVEHADRFGKKILISGGGRCNFTNLHCRPEDFISDNPHFARSALARDTPADFVALVEKHRSPYHEKERGQLFCDRSARDITEMLERECRAAGVRILLGTRVREVRRADRFVVSTADATWQAPALVVATGGLSVPRSGATGLGYDLARQFGLRLRECRPGLVPFRFGAADLARYGELAGVSTEVSVSTSATSFRGQMLFTHRGLSGPAILQASSYWAPGEPLAIDLAPGEDVTASMRSGNGARGAPAARAALRRLLPVRLADRWLESNAPAAWTNPGLAELERRVHGWSVRPEGTEGYAKAEVTAGGVDTGDLSAKTLESRAVPGLYFIGEVVDVTGHLGGYNFQWAWASGAAAGRAL